MGRQFRCVRYKGNLRSISTVARGCGLGSWREVRAGTWGQPQTGKGTEPATVSLRRAIQRQARKETKSTGRMVTGRW